MTFVTQNAQETQDLARQLAQLVPGGTWIRLDGDLGAGKTTFTQGFGKALGIQRAIKSPTYTIVKEYSLGDRVTLVHIDAYRLEEGGADTVDLADYRHPHMLVLVEWAQFIEASLPEEYLRLQFSYGETLNQRHIEVEWVGGAAPSWLDDWTKGGVSDDT